MTRAAVRPILETYWTDGKRLGLVVYVGDEYVNLEDAYTESILRVPLERLADEWREVIPA